MLGFTDTQIKSNTDHYFNMSMEIVPDSPPDLKPMQGEFTIDDKTVSLCLYQNPWIYHHSSKQQNPGVINSIFQYCVVCGINNYADEDFKNLANIRLNINELHLMNCDNIGCQAAIWDLLKDKYVGFVKALIDKNADELKKYADPPGDTL